MKTLIAITILAVTTATTVFAGSAPPSPYGHGGRRAYGSSASASIRLEYLPEVVPGGIASIGGSAVKVTGMNKMPKNLNDNQKILYITEHTVLSQELIDAGVTFYAGSDPESFIKLNP
jgi:hypothetical protein